MWNHRVVKFKAHAEFLEDYYAICEVFYDSTGNPNAHTSDGVRVGGASISELRETLKRMLDCLDKPILEEMK